MKVFGDNAVLKTNSEVERQQFGIADMSIVIQILTKLYSNPIRTLTQEYISNARDANREVNSKRPIEIIAPTRFNPTMFIRDFGPSLSPERIKSVFLFYGASTKRSSNSQTGGFGIGAKSAWSYTDSFTIVTYLDGIKRTYVAHKSHGNGNLDQIPYTTTSTGESLYDEPTDEPNGTEIQIAVNPNDIQRFKDSILRTVFFWHKSEKPIIKGMDKAEYDSSDVLPVFKMDTLEVYASLPNYLEYDSLIVVDGITYPNRSYTPKLDQYNKKKYIIHAPNGKVNIAPNREELINDDITKKYLANQDDILETKVSKHVASVIDSSNNLADALREGVKLYTLFNFDFEYKRYKVTYNQMAVDGIGCLGIQWERAYRRNSKYRKAELRTIDVNRFDCLYYNDIPNEAATKIFWRIKKLLANNSVVYLLNNTIEQSVLDDLKPIPISSIDASDYAVFRAQKASIKKLEICLHYFGRHRGLKPTQVKLAELTNKIVYDIKDEETYNLRNTNKISTYIDIVHKRGMKFAFIAKSAEHLIVKNKNFIKFDKFVDSFKPDNEDILFKIFRDFESKSMLNAIKQLKSIIPQINDDSLKYFANLCSKTFSDSVVYLPDFLFEKCKNTKVYKEYIKHANYLDNFDKKYPLVANVYASSLDDKAFKADVISYMNSKN